MWLQVDPPKDLDASMELNGAAPLPSGHDAAGVAAGPGDFLVGVAISVYQNSGGQGSNWSAFEDQKNFWGRPRILVSALTMATAPTRLH